MDSFIVKALAREDLGKGASRRLRRAGQVPAVLYGAGEPVSLSISHNEMLQHVEQEAFFSHILDIDIEGKIEKAIIRDLQRHPAKSLIMHADFQRVDAKKELHVSVPLHFINEETCPGVKLQGGVIHHLATDIEVACLPANLPEFIEVDVEALEAGSTIHLSELTLPEGVRSIALAQGDSHDAGVVACHKGHGGSDDDDADEAPEGEDTEG